MAAPRRPRRPYGTNSPRVFRWCPARRAALHWIHHNQPAPLVDTATQSKGEGLRSAALAFYSQIQHERHVTGRSTRMPDPQPEYLVEPEHAHLLAPFANPNPL